jgi:hypothetical protein
MNYVVAVCSDTWDVATFYLSARIKGNIPSIGAQRKMGAAEQHRACAANNLIPLGTSLGLILWPSVYVGPQLYANSSINIILEAISNM